MELAWQEALQNFVIAPGPAPAGAPAVGGVGGSLENPTPHSFQSGIGVISGWVCEAETVEVEFNDDPTQRVAAAYGTERRDTVGVCGDVDNGFGLLFNWNLLGAGRQTVRVYVDGAAWGVVPVQVSTLGEEFVRGAAGACVVADFPAPGEQVVVEWQETLQNFVVRAGE